MNKKRTTREGIITGVKPYLGGHVVRVKVDTYLYFPESLSKSILTDEKRTLYSFFKENIYHLLGQIIQVKGKYFTHYGSEYKRLLFVDEVVSLHLAKNLFKTKPHTKDRLLEIVNLLNPRTKITNGITAKILQSPFLPINCSILKDFHMRYTIYKLLEPDAFLKPSDRLISLEIFGNYFVHLFQESMSNHKKGLIYTDDHGYGLDFDYAFQRAVTDLPFIFYEEILDDKVREIIELAKNTKLVISEEAIKRLYPHLTPWFLIRKTSQHGYILYPHYYRAVRKSALSRVKKTIASDLPPIRWDDNTDRQRLAEEIARFLIKFRPHLFVITGDAGTGKSTFVIKLVSYLTKAGINVSVTGVTGKSVKRLNELFISQGEKPIAKTLARELGQKYNGTFTVDMISSEVLIVDEASMIDLYRLSRINKVFSNTNQVLVLVGDPKQLEPIANENVFLSIVNLLKNTPFLLELKNNYRFAPNRKVYVVAVESLKKIPYLIVSLLQKNKILDNPTKWKVATYTHRQEYIGTQYLNHFIRSYITSSDKPFVYGEPALVIDNEVDPKTKSLRLANKEEVKVISVEKDEVYVMSSTGITKISLDKLDYSYAVEYRTVQGEEYDVFIFVAIKGKIDKSVLYTMLTRGKKKVYMLTTRHSLDAILSEFKEELLSVNAQVYKEVGNKKWKEINLL